MNTLQLSLFDRIQYLLMLLLVTASSLTFTYSLPAAAASASQEGISYGSIIIFTKDLNIFEPLMPLCKAYYPGPQASRHGFGHRLFSCLFSVAGSTRPPPLM